MDRPDTLKKKIKNKIRWQKTQKYNTRLQTPGKRTNTSKSTQKHFLNIDKDKQMIAADN